MAYRRQHPALTAGFCLLLLLPGCRDSKTPPVTSAKAPDAGGASNEDSTAGRLSPELFQQAVRLKNRGIGHLENKEWREAEAAFEALRELLPNNRLAVRNLAICCSLTLLDNESPYSRSDDAPVYRSAMAAALETVQALETQFPDEKPLATLMRGKLLAHDDSPERSTIRDAVDTLRAAAAASGDQPEYWFAVALAMDGSREYADSAELIQTLHHCFELAPQNLFVLQKLIEREALALVSGNDTLRQQAAALPETLKQARELILPLNAAILKQRRVNVVEAIDNALTGFNGTNANTLMGPAMMAKNLLLPELATQIDKRRIDRNLLEYLLLEFDAEFLVAARNAGVLPTVAPTVVQGFSVSTILPEISAVTQLDFADMDLDGFDDLIVATNGRIQIYGRGAEVAAEWRLLMETPADAGTFTEFLLADLDRDFDRALSDVKSPSILRDRDGDRRIVTDPSQKNRWFDTDLDIVAWDENGAKIFRNDRAEDGARSLTLLPQSATPQGIFEIVAADLEADGDLDLIAATKQGITIWRNLDGVQFEMVTEGAALPDYPIHGLSVGDWNRDMAMDIVGVSSAGAAGVLQNMLHNRFRWLPGADGLEQAGNATIARIGDFDGNLSWDLVAAGPAGIQIHFTQMSATGTISALKQTVLTTQPVTALQLADLDNDGCLDLVALSESELMIFRGSPDGEFQQITDVLPSNASQLKGTALGCVDYDDDGDLDVVISSPDTKGLTVLLNDGGNSNNWLQVVVRAVGDDPQFPSNRVNMHAVGSVIELKAGTIYQAQIINRPRMHLGMGQSESADAVRVIWTDGVPQNVVTESLLRSRLGILAPQILKGSCPYIYTWTGEKFEFFSDCLWAAPIGLVQANGDLAPTREWEYLLIPGEQLKARGEHYELQFTEELWEAAYFDEVRLVTVDHPADVSVFTNEKVGSPAMAAHRIHTVRNRHLPARIVDGTGRDLLPGLKAQDGDYVQPFRQRVLQGLTDPWLMEFDPGLNSKPQNLRLVLIGWVFPTDTSLNLAIHQNPQLDPPAPPSLEVRDADGNWVVARPFIGFPSGKTKAMVIDLSDVFVSDDLSFRICSSMELYWDAAFLIVDEEDAETKIQDCSLAGADLHYRGFSRRVYDSQSLFRNGHAPENYDYESVTTGPRWPAMMGRFTRYGDTAELIRSQDDRLVVMGPGDELTLKFHVPQQEPPAGWTRDFVLYNVGWDKDADLNTVYGQSSEPYPFSEMAQYPILINESEPDSVQYQQYLRDWQTREYNKRTLWREVLESGSAK